MTDALPLQKTFAGIVADEQEKVAAGAAACGQTCDDGCHGPLVCVRTAHPHDPAADRGTHPVTGQPQPAGNVSPHAAFGPDGALTQWTCLPGDHDGLTADQRAAKRAAELAAARDAATRTLLGQIDPALLVSLLREGGHL